ncbi:MAG: TatD family hydrolase [Bacteroidia bacterium]|nr:TatD family hydrolase [Bacteroidia bacterium]
MSDYPYIDLHTHSETIPQHVVAIRNVFYGDARDYKFKEDRFYSVGLHPWFIEHGLGSLNQKLLESFCSKSYVLAVGEAGLDTTIDQLQDIQIDIFELQLKLAQKLNKPIIIHNVRSASYFQALLKKADLKVPLIFHGYNLNEEITAEFLKKNCYFSFGDYLFRSNYNAVRVLPMIPDNRIFFETDDSDETIDKIYAAAAAIRKTTVEELKRVTVVSFKECFFPDVK